VRAETNLIFSASPQYLWRNLFERAEPTPVAKVSDVAFGLSANLTELPAHDHVTAFVALATLSQPLR
jgi:hypothetical protein